jgi:mannose-1-phosphate guanylyltransferase
LGINPDAPEPEYGYVLPSDRLKTMAPLGVFTISRFIEKPSRGTAEAMILKGGLWNTMVMVFKASTFLHLLRRHFSTLYGGFQRIKEAIESPFEKVVVHETYSGIEPVNFSRDMLEIFALRHPLRFLVLPVRGVFWSDWGSEYRVTDTLKKIGYLEKSPRAFKGTLIDTDVGMRE